MMWPKMTPLVFGVSQIHQAFRGEFKSEKKCKWGLLGLIKGTCLVFVSLGDVDLWRPRMKVVVFGIWPIEMCLIRFFFRLSYL